MTYNTGNAVPSNDPRDLLDNAESFDIRVTSRTERSTPDRLGVERKTWHGMEQDFAEFLAASGFEPNHLIYQEGVPLQVDRPTQLIDYSGSVYRVKMPSTFPVTLSGVSADDMPLLVDIGDFSLRQELANNSEPGKGSSMVGHGGKSVGEWLDDLATVTPLSFGAAGDGMEDDTASIQAAIDFAAERGLGVTLSGRAYAMSRVRIKNGLSFFCGGKLIPILKVGEAAIEFDGGSLGGGPVVGCDIYHIEMDCINGPKRAIYGERVGRCQILSNNIVNIASSRGTIAGIMLCEGSSSNKIAFNNVIGEALDSSGVMIGLYSAGADSYYSYFTKADGSVTQSSSPCFDNTIVGNKTLGGQQGIWLSGTQQNTVVGNTTRSAKDRGIILISSSFCTITGNTCLDFGSSGIHMAYGCNDNVVSGNTVVSLVSTGESGIQCYVGCNRNLISGNRIRTSALYGVYAAVSCRYNKFTNNLIDNYTYCGIGLESDWNSPRPTQAIFSRPSFGAPVTGDKWAFTPSIGNEFSYNTIGNMLAGRPTSAAIYIAQIDSYDGVSSFGLQGSVFIGNSVVGQDPAYNVYIYESSRGLINGGAFAENVFMSNALGKVAVLPAAAQPFRSFFHRCSGNTTIDDGGFIALTANSATPSVERGLLFIATNSSPTVITNFSRGSHGQVITVRGDVNTTIAHNTAAIRTKGATNITGLDANRMVSFRNINGVWFEQWRNF